jgi:hypothetical protein
VTSRVRKSLDEIFELLELELEDELPDKVEAEVCAELVEFPS